MERLARHGFTTLSKDDLHKPSMSAVFFGKRFCGQRFSRDRIT
jgi:hypothetical protein